MLDVVREGAKTYIPGVRKVTWASGEMCEFASSLAAVLEALGEACSYDDLTCIAGAAWRFTLNPGQWDYRNYGIRNICADGYQPVRRTLQMVGLDYTLVERARYDAAYGAPRPDEPAAAVLAEQREDTQRIKDSIDRGAPVLAFGVVGPSDCCVITGYDEGGAVLLGWSTYQDIPDDHNIPHDATGYLRKPDWHPALDGYILPGARRSKPPTRDMLLMTLRWALELARVPQLPGKLTGLAGLAAWADEMEGDAWFPPADAGALGQRYVSVMINLTMLDDHRSAAPFLRRAARELPELAPGLLAAAEQYAEGVRQREALKTLLPEDFSPAAMQSLADGSLRCAYARMLRQIRSAEERAVDSIGKVLSA